jgi:hypothetical protein
MPLFNSYYIYVPSFFVLFYFIERRVETTGDSFRYLCTNVIGNGDIEPVY